jgi:hypothetical protein
MRGPRRVHLLREQVSLLTECKIATQLVPLFMMREVAGENLVCPTSRGAGRTVDRRH